MTQDEIIKMARKAGGVPIGNKEFMPGTINIKTFARLIAGHEREGCAKVVNDDRGLSDEDAIRLMRAIRARGQE